MLIHFSHGTMRSISSKNSRFFVRTCDNSSLRADRLSCLSIPILYHFLRLFALCGIALKELFDQLREGADMQDLCIDGTYIKAHRASDGAKKGRGQ